MGFFISIVIITKNNGRTIERCINSLISQNYPHQSYEIVFVDGNSTDGTLEIIREYSKQYANIGLLSENSGAMGYARNLGISGAKGEIVVFTDGDAVAGSNWIMRIADAFSNNDRLGVLGGLDILKFEDKQGTETSNARASIIDSWRRMERTSGVKAIPCMKTVNLAIRREILEECKGFNPMLKHFDETELLARVNSRLKIWEILYDPEIAVYHLRPVENSFRKRIRKVFKNSAEGIKVLLRKHMIRVALANPVSPIATSVYLALGCIIGIPILVYAFLSGVLMPFIITLLLIYAVLMIAYLTYTSLLSRKFVPSLIFFLSLDLLTRLVGTGCGLVKWLADYLKAKMRL